MTKLHLHASLLAGLALAATGALAQSTGGRIGVKPQPSPPPPVAAVTNPVAPGGPSASGLGSPFPPSAPSLAVPGTSAVGTSPPENVPPDLSPDTSVMGAGPYGTRGLVRAGGNMGPVSAVDIARSFLNADLNRDGELTRTEAMRLALMPLSFEEMDANHDDRLTRSEYETAVRP
ncbi:MAG: hypothetical protein HY854_20770 [Burkholderiales bacterium]|nr:hypothetical protein [Burkholderiales bacterium]